MEREHEHEVTTDAPVLLRVPEAARLASVSRSMMYRLALAEVVPTVRIGSAVRIPRKSLLAWIERRTVNGAQGETDSTA